MNIAQSHLKSVLVAEDDLVTQRILAVALKTFGYEATLCTTGQQCLDILVSGVRPDLMLLDLHLPDMSGFDVLARLQKKSTGDTFPIMVLTARNDPDTVRAALKAGAHDYVVKPFDVHELGKRIKDFVFNGTEETMRGIVENLRVPDHSLFRAPGLNIWADLNVEAYLASHEGKPLAILIPHGIRPRDLVRARSFTFLTSLHVFKKSANGWRKVWPTSACLDKAILEDEAKRTVP